LTEIAGETQRKNGEKSDKDYSIEWFGNTCIIRYKGEIYNRALFKGIPFIDYLGWIAVLFAGIIYIVLGICSMPVVLWITYHALNINFLLGFILSVLFLIPTGLILIGFGSFLSIPYIKNTTCKKCHKKYAYEERKEPDVKEVSTEKSYKVTITRYWKCKYCGNIDISESPETVRCYKVRKGRKVEIKCEKCSRTGILPECRRPDAKVVDYMATTDIRYYRCEGCGHINIAVQKGLSSMDGTISYESRGSDPRL
jgi:hypothetical protein